MTHTPEQVQSLFIQAKLAAKAAVKDYYVNKLQGQDAMPCGFGWVEIYGIRANSKIGKVFAEFGCKKSYNGSITVWDPGEYRGQNIDAKYAGAKAFAQVFKDAGFDKVYACDRMD
jgi:hypothetical protein